MQDKDRSTEEVVRFPRRSARRLLWLLLLATILLLVGLVAPLLTISQFVFVRNSFSVVSGILELYRHGQILLFMLITFFSVILPLLKLWVLFRVLVDRRSHRSGVKRYLHMMHDYGRWSMLDVLVVAILIVMVKLGTFATVQVHFGLYVFCAAVLLIMFITNRVVRLTTAQKTRDYNS